MRTNLIVSVCICFALLVAAAYAATQQQGNPPRKMPPGLSNLTLTSPAFASGGEFPVKYAAARGAAAISPKLEWTGVPEGTVSFALIFHDPDAALNKTLEDYLHWLVFNIPGNVRELQEGMPPTPKLPDGTIQAKTRGTTVGYLGPGAPASGPVHHYTFELYALDTMLDLGQDATRDDALKAINGHILGKALLIGRFRQSAN